MYVYVVCVCVREGERESGVCVCVCVPKSEAVCVDGGWMDASLYVYTSVEIGGRENSSISQRMVEHEKND